MRCVIVICWSFVKSLRNNASSFPTLIMNDEAFTDPDKKANLLAGLFAANSQLPARTQPLAEIEKVWVTMSSIFFRAKPVKRVLADLNLNKSNNSVVLIAKVESLENEKFIFGMKPLQIFKVVLMLLMIC